MSRKRSWAETYDVSSLLISNDPKSSGVETGESIVGEMARKVTDPQERQSIILQAKWDYVNNLKVQFEKSLPFDIIEVKRTLTPFNYTVRGSKYHMTELINRKWSVVRRATLVVCKKTHGWKIVALFITNTVYSHLNTAMQDTDKAIAGFRKYYTPKDPKRFYSPTRNRKICFQGESFLDGLQSYNKRNSHVRHVEFVKRRTEADQDLAFESSRQKLVFNMHYIEWLLVPALAQHRFDVALKSGHIGLIPGADLRYCSATTLGISSGFSCNPHRDSHFPGTSETIFWKRPTEPNESPATKRQCFCIVDYSVVFDVECDTTTCIFMNGTSLHGTPLFSSTHDKHDGFGCVIMSKLNLSRDTKFQRTTFKKLRSELQKPVEHQ